MFVSALKMGVRMGRPKRDFTPDGWEPGEKRPYNPIRLNRLVRKDKNLSHAAKPVMAEILEAGGGNGYCYPSMNVIAENCGMSRQHVWEQIQELKEKGYLHIDSASGRSAVYRPMNGLLYGYVLELPVQTEGRTCQPEITRPVNYSLQIGVNYGLHWGCKPEVTGQTHNSLKEQAEIETDSQKCKKEKISEKQSEKQSQDTILNQVIEFTGDNGGRETWAKICSSLSEEIIQAAIRKTEAAPNVRNRTAYLNHILQDKLQAVKKENAELRKELIDALIRIDADTCWEDDTTEGDPNLLWECMKTLRDNHKNSADDIWLQFMRLKEKALGVDLQWRIDKACGVGH